LIQQNQHRLQHNLDLMKQNVFLQLVQQQVQTNPELAPVAALWNLPVQL